MSCHEQKDFHIQRFSHMCQRKRCVLIVCKHNIPALFHENFSYHFINNLFATAVPSPSPIPPVHWGSKNLNLYSCKPSKEITDAIINNHSLPLYLPARSGSVRGLLTYTGCFFEKSGYIFHATRCCFTTPITTRMAAYIHVKTELLKSTVPWELAEAWDDEDEESVVDSYLRGGWRGC